MQNIIIQRQLPIKGAPVHKTKFTLKYAQSSSFKGNL